MLFPTSCSIRFCVSGFVLRSLNHVDLSFVPGNIYVSIYIFLNTVIHLEQDNLLKIFSTVYLLIPSQNSGIQKSGLYLYLHLGICFGSIDSPVYFGSILCNFYYYSSVVQLEMRDGDISRSSFIGQVCFIDSGLFVFPYEII